MQFAKDVYKQLCSESAMRLALLLIAVFVSSAQLASGQIVINEILASNATGLADEDGDTEDWIELFNAGSESVSLLGVGLSDDPDTPYRWMFPDVVIAPGQFLLVWASGKDRTDPGSPLHANFAIARTGEHLILTGADGVPMDDLPPTPLPTDVSFGRAPDGSDTWRFFTTPTPSLPNPGEHFARVLTDPELSHPPGFYDGPFDLTVSHPHTAATLHYTTDGSIPTTADPIFPGTLSMISRATDPNIYSEINTTFLGSNVNDHMWQPPLGLVDKCTILRVRAFAADSIPSRTVTASYFVDSEQHEAYTLPVISLVVESNDFFSASTGIYVGGNATRADQTNFRQSGPHWERPIHIEFFEQNRQLGFRQDAGVRIHGGASRHYSLKSLRLYARNIYGESAFNYQIFPDLPADSFQRLILRNSGQDIERTFFRDALLQRLVGHMRFDTQAYRPVIVFLNGEYWGIHNIRERYDSHYHARTHGVDPDNLDILEGNHSARTDMVVKQGNATHYAAMRNYVATHGVVNDEHFEHIQTLIDTDNYLDYLVANIYLNNVDWPGNNIEYWRLRTEHYQADAPYGHDGRWRWVLFDTDHAYAFYPNGVRSRVSHNTLSFATATSGPNWPNPPWSTFLARNMLMNHSFRNQFINRMCDQLNTAFQPQRIHALIDEMKAVLEPEMGRHVARHRRPSSLQEWEEHVDVLRDFATQRPAHQLNHITQYFSLPGVATVTVDITPAETGTIQINTIEINESTLGLAAPDSPYPWSGTYVRGIPLSLTAHPAPGYRFIGWESLANTNAQMDWTLTADLALTAVFEEISSGASIWSKPTSGPWNDADNWTTTNYPTGPDAIAIIAPLEAGNLDIELIEDVHIGNLHIHIPDDAARLRIEGSTHHLTFASTDGAADLHVAGDGNGYVELNIDGGIQLESDVRIHTESTTAGHPEYGAIRLRRGWQGSGGLIKSGPGTLSMTGGEKHYSGATTIEEGVLRLTEPASPSLSTQVVVHAGGQLQWTSGNTPRTYHFGGSLRLYGMGPDPLHPTGALQYDPGATGLHQATLLTPLIIADDAGIDVPHAGNRLRLHGPIVGNGQLVKRGAGILEIDGAGHVFNAAILVEEGVLDLAATVDCDINLAEGGILSGAGRSHSVSGAGTIQLTDTILTADAVAIPEFRFLIRHAGGPNYALPHQSGNALLRLRGPNPFPSSLDNDARIHVYLQLDRSPTDIYRGGFWLDEADDFMPLVQNAQWWFYEADTAGEHEFAGERFTLIDEPFIVDTATATASFNGTPVAGRILRFRPLTSSLPYDHWLQSNFTTEEQDDPAISGPTVKDAAGWPHLLRYAFGLQRDEDPDFASPSITRLSTYGGDVLTYRFRRRTEFENGLRYTVEAAEILGDPWQPIEALRPDITLYSIVPTGDGRTEDVHFYIPTPDNRPLYLRLRIDKL